MTKRLNSKHKVDRRLKVNLWGRPKSPFNKRAYGPGQHGQSKPANRLIMVFNYKLNKNLKLTMEILMRDNLEIYIKKPQCLKVTQVKTLLVF